MRESRWPPPFTRALKRNLQGSFFVWWWVVDVRCWWSVGRTEAAILYWANWADKAYRANKTYRADMANSAQRLIRLIRLMLFYLGWCAWYGYRHIFSKSKKKETLIYGAIKLIWFMRLIGIIGLIRGIYSLIVFFWSLLFSYFVSCLLRKELFTVACFLVVEVVKVIIEAVFLPFFI